MKDLKCALKMCAFNKGYACCAREITVTTNADCRSYTPDPGKKSDKMFELGLDQTKPDFSVDTKVNCTAPCVFQKENYCVAAGITVLPDQNNAECATFILK